jgi:ethanolamine ammonia-lyase small subunit
MVADPFASDPRLAAMRAASPARIGLKRAGSAIATSCHLAFQLAHAQARDAVHDAFDPEELVVPLQSLGLKTARLHSAAGDREVFLLRPDLGRRLDEASAQHLFALPKNRDLTFVIADGLSARAIARHAIPLLTEALARLRRNAWKIGPACLVEQGRVAIGDEIGEILQTRLVAVLIGERPGLTSPDSLGVYLTFEPSVGRTDAERNCLSNIRPQGMSYAEAAHRLCFLCEEARRRRLTGTALKDESHDAILGS